MNAILLSILVFTNLCISKYVHMYVHTSCIFIYIYTFNHTLPPTHIHIRVFISKQKGANKPDEKSFKSIASINAPKMLHSCCCCS